jgi:argininosuccinate lyase
VTLQSTLDCHDVIGGTATIRVKAALLETQKRVSALTDAGAPEVAHVGA